jgi:hypothetical protein
MMHALDPHPEAELELHKLVEGPPTRAQEVGRLLRDFDGLLADPDNVLVRALKRIAGTPP